MGGNSESVTQPGRELALAMPEGPLAPELAAVVDQVVAALQLVPAHERERVLVEASTRLQVRKKMPKSLGIRRYR